MNRNFFRLLLSAVLMMCCVAAWADDEDFWTIIEEPTCSKYGTMKNTSTNELRLVPKLPHQFVNGECTVCGHAAPSMYRGTLAESLVTITEENYVQYGLTATNKGCVMGWTVITTSDEFMKYYNSSDSWNNINFNAFLAEDILLDDRVNLPEINLGNECVFDGTGHTISNVYRNGDRCVGLFTGNSGIIRNLGLISPKIVVCISNGGCFCGNNNGTIENCFVIDGYIEGADSDLYGIANQKQGAKILNCYAITNKGNVGKVYQVSVPYPATVTNSYGATTGRVPDDFYANTLAALNGQKANGITWYPSAAKYPVMMSSMIYYPATMTCTESGLKEHWYCSACGKYFLDADHTQETTLENLPSPALGHNLSIVNGKAHCDRCDKDFDAVAIDDKPVLLNCENDSYFLDKLELKYGHSYSADTEFTAKDFSYTFPYYPNVWNSWFVPFEITTDELDAEGFTAAYIAGVRQYETDAEGNVITQVDVIKIKDGYLFAGTPYLIKQESSATEPLIAEFNKTGATLKKSSDVNPLNSATTTANYNFIGTYNEIAKEDAKDYYILGSEGAFVHPSSPVYPMNWYMKIKEKGSAYGQYSSQAKAFIINVIGEEDQSTGIRTLYPVEK